MSAYTLMAEVASYGATLVRTGDGLKVQAPAPLPEDLRARLRAHKAELLRLLEDEFVTSAGNGEAEKSGQTFTHYGRGYRHADGRVESGQPEPMPRPVAAWPTDLDSLLRRVSTAFEWSDQDRRDFVAWARRDQQGIDDARQFLQHECDKLPQPGLSDRRRTVLDMLEADPAVNYAWTCADDGADPVRLTLAVRGRGTCELAIPRERFDALGLPMLIDKLTQGGTP